MFGGQMMIACLTKRTPVSYLAPTFGFEPVYLEGIEADLAGHRRPLNLASSEAGLVRPVSCDYADRAAKMEVIYFVYGIDRENFFPDCSHHGLLSRRA